MIPSPNLGDIWSYLEGEKMKDKLKMANEILKENPPPIKYSNESLLVRWANLISGFYGKPVYLVGSSTVKGNPRDIDVVCVIPDEEFMLRYQVDSIEQWGLRYRSGSFDLHESTWRWADDCCHKALQGMQFTHKYIDFKVYPESYDKSQFADKVKIKLDARSFLIP